MRRVRALAGSIVIVFGAAAWPAAQAEVWTIDPNHSSAQFAARHMLVSTVRGTLGKISGTIQYDGKDVRSIKADVTIDVAGLNTGVERRDNDLRSANFFDAANNPTITFKSKRVEPAGDGRFKLIGDLTIRGNTHEVALEVEGPTPVLKNRNQLRTGATASGRISRKSFGLLWNNLTETGGAIVGDEIQMTIDIEATKQAAVTP
jgi:polyisoprenoid-binding protein YceI